jgi:hypothetical protein
MICGGVIGTFCVINAIAFAVARAGGNLIDLTQFNAAFHDFVLIIVSASAGVAFGRRGGAGPEVETKTP